MVEDSLIDCLQLRAVSTAFIPLRWAEKAVACSYAAPASKYHMDSYQPHGRSLRDIPRRALSISSSSLWSATIDIALSFPSHPGTRDRPVRRNDICQQCLLDPGNMGSAQYCGSGTPFFAVDSDDCRSSDVTPASSSPDIRCSPSDSMDASDGNTEGPSDYQR